MTTPVTPTYRTVTCPNGTTLQYVEQGNRDGTPVLFLHGFTDSLVSFSPVLPLLPPSIRAIALSQRGHGDSSRPVTGYRIGDFAGDVIALLDHLGIEQSVVVGHSMGSIIAMRTAIDHPDRVRGLVLIGAFGSPLSQKPDMVAFAGVIAELTDPVPAEFAREFQESTIVQPLPPGFLDIAVSESMKLPASVWQQVMEGLMAEDVSGGLASILVPTQIIWGDQDAFARRDDQEYLLRGIPGAALVVYEGTGHAVQWEQPARVAADVTEFVKRVTT